MKNVIIFGAGSLGRTLAKELESKMNIVGFIDNNKELWGNEVAGYKVLGGTKVIHSVKYDEIVVASTMRYDDICDDLKQEGITQEKFNREIQNRLLVEVQARVNFLRDFSKEYGDEEKEAAVAEGGVFQGMFASEINRFFPARKLYLFDTFEGFHRKDVEYEVKKCLSESEAGRYQETSVEAVLNRMPYKEQIVIKKGYFPDTLVGIEDKFLFVNLDFDLYSPTIEGLRYFYPRMVKHGAILIHDYFTEIYHGIREAVNDFEYETGAELRRVPIGDGISIAIIV